MSRELGNRIVSHVVATAEKAGLELLLERSNENTAREFNTTYRAVPRSGLVPFAELHALAGGMYVLTDVSPLPLSADKRRLAYYIADPGKTPDKGHYAYTDLYEWFPTPEALAEAVTAALRELAPPTAPPF